MRYIVETYAAPGCAAEPKPIEFSSLKRARAEARKRLGVSALRPERRWKPRKPGAVEAYRAHVGRGETGGVIIFLERGDASSGQRRIEPAASEPFEAGDRATEKRVMRAIGELGSRGGGRWGPIRIADLKKHLGSPPQAAFSRVLLDLQEQELVTLIREDNPPDITAADREAAVLIAGNPRHLVVLA